MDHIKGFLTSLRNDVHYHTARAETAEIKTIVYERMILERNEEITVLQRKLWAVRDALEKRGGTGS